jgi:4-carboxymuconolactone decarboxylase
MRYCAARCCATWYSVSAYVRFGSSIPVPLDELAICMTGRKWGSQYEFYEHRRVGIQAGLSSAIVEAVATGHRPTDTSSDETEIYDSSPIFSLPTRCQTPRTAP